MSSRPWVAPHLAKTARISSSDWTSHGSTKVEPIDAASGRTRFSMRLSTELKPTVAPCLVEAPGRSPRRSSGRWRPRRSAPSCRRAVPSAEPSRRVPSAAMTSLTPRRLDRRALPRPAVRPDRRPGAPARPRRGDRPQGRAAARGRRGAGRARGPVDPVPDRDEHLAHQPGRACRAGATGSGHRSRPSRIMSALSASAAFTRHRYPGEPLFVMASTDALTEFAGQRLLSGRGGRRARTRRAAAVVVGDAPEAVTFDNLNRAFRLVRAGAELIGMHRNPWWLTPDGPTLDSGALVTGLEFATERSGPDPRQAVAGLLPRGGRRARRRRSAERGGRRLVRHDIAMVGDDIRTDVRRRAAGGPARGVRPVRQARPGRRRDASPPVAAVGRPDGIAPTLRRRGPRARLIDRPSVRRHPARA